MNWKDKLKEQFGDFYDIGEPNHNNPDAGSEKKHFKRLESFIEDLLQKQEERFKKLLEKKIKIHKQLSEEIMGDNDYHMGAIAVLELLEDDLKTNLTNLK